MIYEIEFSPTGGTDQVLEAVTAQWQEEKKRIDLSDPGKDFSKLTFRADDLCFIAVPSYGGRGPAPAIERLGQMNGGGAAAVMICAFGNRAYEDTLLELSDVLTRQGFCCEAAVAAVAQHSIMPQFGSGRPDTKDRDELSAFAARIKEKLDQGLKCEADGRRKTSVKVPGNRPYREYGGVPLIPKANQRCEKCAVCAAKCPVGAIDPADPSKTDKTRCISCMRCILVCPHHARKLNEVMVFAASQKLKKVCSSRKDNELFLEG